MKTLDKYVDNGKLTDPDGLALKIVLSQYNCRRTVLEVAGWFGLLPYEADEVLAAEEPEAVR